MTSTGKKDKNQHIQVFVRVRPLNKQEGNTNCAEIRNNKELIIKHHSTTRTYNFDKIFGPDSKQLDVYKLVAEPTVREVIAGYNCTVLAYGQTGTGKTYTMAGGTVTDMSNINTNSSWFEDVHSGIIPRTLSHMFDELRVQQVEYTVRVSYLELYNEEIFDLLSPVEDNNKLKLYDDNLKKGSVIVSGLTETTVNTKSEVFRILEKGAEKRRIAATLMNNQSSRSHTVFCIIVHTKENSIDGEDLLKTGKLYLVDLAGSENIKQSGATDVRAREAFSINQSLLTLGRVISKLVERSGHIPYRESKLTRLLQDSLGGRTKTTLIATVSPASCNADESINTLEYASRAKNITNKPEINQRLSKKTLMKEYTEEIERLRKDLQANRMGKGIYLNEENYESLMRERDIHKDEITEKINMIRVMQEEMVRKEQLCEQLKIYLEEHQKQVEIKVTTINTLENQLQEASKEITDLQEENELKEFMVSKYSETEEQLKSTAKELLTVADTTTTESRKLHDKLDTLADITKQNKQVCEQHIVEFSSKMTGICNNVQTAFDSVSHFIEQCNSTTATLIDNSIEAKNKSEQLLVEIDNRTDKHIKSHQNILCNSESARIAYDLASNNISQSCDCEFKTVQDKFNDTIVRKIRDVHECNIQRENVIVEFTTNLRQTIANHNSTMKEFVSSTKKLIQKTKEVERLHIERQLDIVAKLEESFEKQEQERNAYKSEIQSNQRQVIEMMKSMMDLTEKFTMKSQEREFENKKEIASLQNYLEDHKTSYSACSDKTIDDIDKFSQDMRKTTQGYNEIIQTYEQQQAELTSTIKYTEQQTNEAFNKFIDYTQSSFKNVQTACIQEFGNIEQMDNKYNDSYLTYSKDLHDWFISHKAAIEFESNNCYETSMKCLDSMRALSTEFDSHSNEMETKISTDLDNSREGIRKLFTSSLKEYKVTGETPQRKFYRYPRTLMETKPTEKLVEEYYSSRLTDEIAEEKENDSGNENIENSVIQAQTQLQTSRIPTKVVVENEYNLAESNINRQNLKERPEDNQ